jgi:Fur family ferric uptake transcriptional regulator
MEGDFNIIENENDYQYQEFIMNEHPWLSQLNEQGYRLTGSRRAVVETIAASVRALTPIEVYDTARKSHPALGLVTVYRTLEKLEELHVIQRVHQPRGCQAFIAASQEHEHLLLCQNCGQVTFFEGDDLDTLIGAISKKTGYQIREHWLQLFGLCQACK